MCEIKCIYVKKCTSYPDRCCICANNTGKKKDYYVPDYPYYPQPYYPWTYPILWCSGDNGTTDYHTCCGDTR